MPNKEVFPEYMCICVVCVLMYRYVRVVCVHVCVVFFIQCMCCTLSGRRGWGDLVNNSNEYHNHYMFGYSHHRRAICQSADSYSKLIGILCMAGAGTAVLLPPI